MSETKDLSLQLYEQFQQIYVLLDDGDRRALREVGLTPTQYNLLRQLDPATAPALTITRLSQVLLCTRGNITRLVRRMEQQNLVQCNPHVRDQRLVIVSLTAEGATRLVEAHAVYTAAIQRRIDSFEKRDQQMLHTLLRRVVTELQADLGAQPTLPGDPEAEEIGD